MDEKWRIAVFAHNEEKSIAETLKSIFASFQSNSGLQIYVLANGCTDRTVEIVRGMMGGHPEIKLITIAMADKCNAWNEYVYQHADDSFCHFFCDGDVTFSLNAFQIMKKELMESSESHAAAGVPLSGRGRKKYVDIIEKFNGAIYGNLYAVKHSFLEKVREKRFKLPIGYLVDDNLIGNIIVTDIDKNVGRKKRIVWDYEAGYRFKSLNPFSIRDIKIYWNRLVRYRLGELQHTKLKSLQYDEYPATMDDINRQILEDLQKTKIHPFNFIMKEVMRRLTACTIPKPKKADIPESKGL